MTVTTTKEYYNQYTVIIREEDAFNEVVDYLISWQNDWDFCFKVSANYFIPLKKQIEIFAPEWLWNEHLKNDIEFTESIV